jgi:hypothetical protein
MQRPEFTDADPDAAAPLYFFVTTDGIQFVVIWIKWHSLVV